MVGKNVKYIEDVGTDIISKVPAFRRLAHLVKKDMMVAQYRDPETTIVMMDGRLLDLRGIVPRSSIRTSRTSERFSSYMAPVVIHRTDGTRVHGFKYRSNYWKPNPKPRLVPLYTKVGEMVRGSVVTKPDPELSKYALLRKYISDNGKIAPPLMQILEKRRLDGNGDIKYQIYGLFSMMAGETPIAYRCLPDGKTRIPFRVRMEQASRTYYTNIPLIHDEDSGVRRRYFSASYEVFSYVKSVYSNRLELSLSEKLISCDDILMVVAGSFDEKNKEGLDKAILNESDILFDNLEYTTTTVWND